MSTEARDLAFGLGAAAPLRPVTLHADHVLCLFSPASAALSHAFYAAARLGATLHVTPDPYAAIQDVDRGDLQCEIERFSPQGLSHPPLQIVEPSDATLPDILASVSSGTIDLVVTGASPVRALFQYLDCPLLLAGYSEPSSISHLLVPTDLSEHALAAFRHAAGLAQLYDASVEVLHVIDSIPYVALTPVDRLSLGPTSLSEHRGRRALRTFLQRGETPEVPVHSHLAYGDAAEQIGRFVSQNDVDLLVLSTHGSGGRPNRPFGRVTERILEEQRAPLLVLPSFGTSLLSRPPDTVAEDPS